MLLALDGPAHPCAPLAHAKPSDACAQLLLKARGTTPRSPVWVSRPQGANAYAEGSRQEPTGCGCRKPWRPPLLLESEFGSGQNQAALPRAQTEKSRLYLIPLTRFGIDPLEIASSVRLELASGVSKKSPAPGASCTLPFCLSRHLHPRMSLEPSEDSSLHRATARVRRRRGSLEPQGGRCWSPGGGGHTGWLCPPFPALSSS